MPTYNYYAFYTAGGTAYTGGTVTVDMYNGGGGTVLSTGGTPTPMGGGLYKHTYTGAVDDPIAVFKNSDTGVDIMHQAFFSLKSITIYDSTAGAGSTSTPITINDGVNPLDGVEVWATTDISGNNVVARGFTNASGLVTLLLDPGTYYIWKSLSGYSFTNPSTLVV